MAVTSSVRQTKVLHSGLVVGLVAAHHQPLQRHDRETRGQREADIEEGEDGCDQRLAVIVILNITDDGEQDAEEGEKQGERQDHADRLDRKAHGDQPRARVEARTLVEQSDGLAHG